jgi:hypothetical protein
VRLEKHAWGAQAKEKGVFGVGGGRATVHLAPSKAPTSPNGVGSAVTDIGVRGTSGLVVGLGSLGVLLMRSLANHLASMKMGFCKDPEDCLRSQGRSSPSVTHALPPQLLIRYNYQRGQAVLEDHRAGFGP